MQDKTHPSKIKDEYNPGDTTYLDLLKWLDVKRGEQQQVTGPWQDGLSQLGHWKGQTQVYQQHTHTFDPQHTAGC